MSELVRLRFNLYDELCLWIMKLYNDLFTSQKKMANVKKNCTQTDSDTLASRHV